MRARPRPCQGARPCPHALRLLEKRTVQPVLNRTPVPDTIFKQHALILFHSKQHALAASLTFSHFLSFSSIIFIIMPPRYKRSRPASSVAAGRRSTSRFSTASPPSDTDSSDHEAHQDAGGANTEEDAPPPFPGFGVFSGAGTSGAGPSFQGTSTVSNDEVLARMLSRMDVFDTRLTGMESMIADRFQSIEIMHGSLDSCLDTLQGHYQGLSTQLQTVIQLLQPPPPPPPEA
ncbi:hypothetical protein JCGZ_15012 [Jatropha curcas]|uniref:Uncharacterized protein n=1 Tax=Jatropha curcas TaxID=180498 RepID=A0A067K6E6_JATCU|nr:hypothetical protein JCGZ_15012 [Jatropha curcas]